MLGERGVALDAPVGIDVTEALGLGDVNGDGLADVAVTLVFQSEPLQIGTLVVFGRPALTGRHQLQTGFPGTVSLRVRNPEAARSFPILSYVGDVNGDRYADV